MTDAISAEPLAIAEAPALEPAAPPVQEDVQPEAPAPKDKEAPKSPQSIRDSLLNAQKAVKEGTSDRARDEQGRFAPKPLEQAPDATQKPVEAKVQPEAPKAPAPVTDAPSRFTPDAKAAWATTPDPVKAEVSRAFREMETGLQQYQQRMEPLKPFFQMAEQHGTTVHDAMERYTTLDWALRNKPDEALPEIFRVAGVNPQEWAARMLGQQAPQGQADNRDQTIGLLQRELASLRQQLEPVTGYIQSQQQSAEQQQIESAWSDFKSAHPRADELLSDINTLLELGKAQTIEDAYAMAERINPAPAPAVSTNPAKPQPLKPSPQISGAPSAGSNPAARRPSSSIRESLERAQARQV
jgi:hypothetical protein